MTTDQLARIILLYLSVYVIIYEAISQEVGFRDIKAGGGR